MSAFEIVEVEPMTALVRTATCPPTDLGPVVGRLFGEITAGNPDADCIAPPCVFYTTWTPEACSIEAAIPVEDSVVAASGTEKRFFPAKRAARMVHVGPYEGLAAAWSRFWSAIQADDVDAAGACWDAYVTDPGSEPDASKWVTELYIPLR
ncbi:MAG TPA: GyrI-like domain-containing protein [Fimbriimonadaceae bacterium]|nr:GyrI-like domain-containing protein [Fimbriimonadaceae bacterium]